MAQAAKTKLLQDQLEALQKQQDRMEAIRGLEGEALSRKQKEFEIEDKLDQLKRPRLAERTPPLPPRLSHRHANS
jgi:hypothetical protein